MAAWRMWGLTRVRGKERDFYWKGKKIKGISAELEKLVPKRYGKDQFVYRISVKYAP